LKIGAQAELFAVGYLRQHGLKLIAQNYRCRFGEIDLIMQDGEMLVFIEVRLRNSNKFGGASASIDFHKQRKLICTAQLYLSRLSYIPPCRFDAILLKSPAPQARLSPPSPALPDKDSLLEFKNSDLEWIKNAFSA
jgi:putative endonuclease